MVSSYQIASDPLRADTTWHRQKLAVAFAIAAAIVIASLDLMLPQMM